MGKNVTISTLPNIGQNYLPKINSSGIFANSLVYDDGSSVLINTTTASAFRLDVNGSIRATSGTLTGALSGTSATFSTNLSTSNPILSVSNTGTYGMIGISRGTQTSASAGINYYTTTVQKWFTGIYENTDNFGFYSVGTAGFPLTLNYSTGAATFSSSVTAGIGSEANNTLSVNANGYMYLDGNTNGLILANNVGADCRIRLEDANEIRFETSSTRAMTIDSSQRVGIGTSSPNYQLELGGSSPKLSLAASGATGYNEIYFHRSTTTTVGYIGVGVNSTVTAAGDEFVLQNSLSTGNLVFRTNNAGTVAERMRITSGGYLKASYNGTYAGSTTNNFEFIGNDNGAHTFRLWNNNVNYAGASVLRLGCDRTSTNNAYSLIIATNGNSTGEFYVRDSGNVANTNGSYGTISSDIRLKENIINANSKLEDIMKLRVVNFNFIGNEQKQIGFIAQEMENVFPSLVVKTDTRKYDDDGNLISGLEDTRGLKVGMEFAILVKAIQELKAELDTLKK